MKSQNTITQQRFENIGPGSGLTGLADCKTSWPFPSTSKNRSAQGFLGSQKPAEAMGRVTSSSAFPEAANA